MKTPEPRRASVGVCADRDADQSEKVKMLAEIVIAGPKSVSVSVQCVAMLKKDVETDDVVLKLGCLVLRVSPLNVSCLVKLAHVAVQLSGSLLRDARLSLTRSRSQ